MMNEKEHEGYRGFKLQRSPGGVRGPTTTARPVSSPGRDPFQGVGRWCDAPGLNSAVTRARGGEEDDKGEGRRRREGGTMKKASQTSPTCLVGLFVSWLVAWFVGLLGRALQQCGRNAASLLSVGRLVGWLVGWSVG